MKFEVRNGRYSLTRLIAGFVLVGASLLAVIHHPLWAIVSGFIGLFHLTSAALGFCPMEKFLHHVFGFPVKGLD